MLCVKMLTREAMEVELDLEMLSRLLKSKVERMVRLLRGEA